MTLVLDGAMGTELSKRGVQTKLPLWTAESNISHPYLVEQIHKEYIQSGADIITTKDTKRTAARALAKTPSRLPSFKAL